MDDLIMEKTSDRIGINFCAETGVLEMRGSSYPENTIEFFEPVINWINKYMLEITGKITMNMKLDYLNSSSVKFISDIIDKLSLYHKSGAEVEINWFYDEDDEDIREMGEDLMEETKLPFNLVKN